MLTTLTFRGQDYRADLATPVSLALPLKPDASSIRAWDAPPVEVAPVRVGDWVGEVRQGAPVNFVNVRVNPHGNGTHTETVGHIAPDWDYNTVLRLLPPGHFVSILHDAGTNVCDDGDSVVDCSGLRQNPPDAPGLIVRALGRDHEDANLSGTNPPYFRAEDLAFLADCGVQHLITDLPSVDREEDGGALAGHHAFWRYPNAVRHSATITELARLNFDLAEGLYLTSLNALPLAADASPSHPLIYLLARTEAPAPKPTTPS